MERRRNAGAASPDCVSRYALHSIQATVLRQPDGGRFRGRLLSRGIVASYEACGPDGRERG